MPRNKYSANDALRQALADAIEAVFSTEYGFITIHYVACASDLSAARVGVTVLPDLKEKDALKALAKKTKEITAQARQSIRIRRMPRITWELSRMERHAREIDIILEEINRK